MIKVIKGTDYSGSGAGKRSSANLLSLGIPLFIILSIAAFFTSIFMSRDARRFS